MTDASPGHPFLSFLNTVRDDGKSRRDNSFATGDALLAEVVRIGIAPPGTAAPGQSQMNAILSLREAGYALFSALAAGRRPGREEALQIESAIKGVIQDAQFAFRPDGLTLGPGPLGGLQDRLALSLLDLLQTGDINRLKECDRCTHLFLDHGRGQGRRWCAMARCGNRAKMETFRNRQRAQNSQGPRP